MRKTLKIEKKYLDKSLSMDIRREHYAEKIKKMMNPIPEKDFNPDTFETAGEDMRQVANRERMELDKFLPTYGIFPKKIMEGQMIGMLESKQDIYLTMAHKCNDLQKQIDSLTKAIETLQKK